jgi:transcriptional regulator with XRE-family HTH domain
MSVASKLKLLAKLKRKKYRDAYVEEHVRTSLPFQIRALREQREWTQGKLAEELKTTQTAVSRLENPEYGKLSLNSLYKLASAFDVALLIKFVPFSRLVEEFKDVSPQALSVTSFDKELETLEEWVAESELVTEEPEPATVGAAAPRVKSTSTTLLRPVPSNVTGAPVFQRGLPFESTPLLRVVRGTQPEEGETIKGISTEGSFTVTRHKVVAAGGR